MSEGKKLHGSDAAWDVASNAIEHASDINAGVFTRHMAAPSVAGNIMLDDSTEWLSTPANTHVPVPPNARGDLIVADAIPKWVVLPLAGATGSVLTRDASDPNWSGYYLSGTAGGTTDFDVTAGKTLTFVAADDYTITFPNSISFPADAVGVLTNDGVGGLSWGPGGGGAPGGADTQIQYNDSGAFGGDAAFTFDNGTKVVTHAGDIYFADDGISTLRQIFVEDQTTVDSDGNPLSISAGKGNGIGSGGTLYLNGADDDGVGFGGGIALRPGSGGILSGFVYFVDPTTNFNASFTTWTLSDDREYYLPDENGTFALGTGTATYIPYWASTNTIVGSANMVWQDALQRMEIGGARPEASASTSGLNLVGDDTRVLSAQVVQWFFGTGSNPSYLGFRARGTISTPTGMSSGDTLVTLSGGGWRGPTATDFSGTAGRVGIYTNEAWSATANGTRVDIWTTPNTQTSANIAVVASFANAGITFSTHLVFTDATYDIGASGATRPRSLYLSANAVVGGTITATGVVNPLTTAAESWVGPSTTTGIYFKGGDVGIGTATPNIGLTGDAENGPVLTIRGVVANERGCLELANYSGFPDIDAGLAGGIGFTHSANLATYKTVAAIYGWSDGTTATKRGGAMVFYTQPNNSAGLVERLRLSQTGAVRVAAELRIAGEIGGVASTNTFTGTSNVAANSTGVGTILFKGATSRNSTGFIKIYVGTTAYYVPFFSAITG